MKAELAAKTFYSAVVIATVAVLAAPLASALLDISGDGWELEASTPSEYDLEGMNGESLAANIVQAVGDRTDARVLYGNAVDPVTSASAKDVAERVLASGAASARVVGADGKTLAQTSIVYRDDLSERTVMEIAVPSVVSNIASVDVRVGYRGSGISLPTMCECSKDGSTVRLDYTVPTFAKYAALALGCDELLEVRLSYGASAVFEGEVLTGTVGGITFHSPETDRDVLSGIPSDASASGTIGGYTDFSMGGGKLELDGRNARPSDSISDSIKDDGLTIVSGGSSLTLPADVARGLADALKALENGRQSA